VTADASISFDRLAHCYDATRGGLARGVAFAPALARWCAPNGPVLEVGVGTGAIAVALRGQLGRAVVGLDLAPAMLAVARERLGPCVGVADVQQLSVPDAAVATLVASWVLHLVGDPAAMLRECRRVVRGDGRLLLVSARGEVSAQDMDAVMRDLTEEIRGRADVRERLEPIASAAGWTIVAEDLTDEERWADSPAAIADRTEARLRVALLDVDDETYDRCARPMVEALRALPDPTRPREHVGRHRLFVLEPQ